MKADCTNEKNALVGVEELPTASSPFGSDYVGRGIVERVTKHFQAAQRTGDKVAGQQIRDLVNGVRVTVEGRHLGSGAGVIQQARAGGGRKPGVGSADARDVQGG